MRLSWKGCPSWGQAGKESKHYHLETRKPVGVRLVLHWVAYVPSEVHTRGACYLHTCEAHARTHGHTAQKGGVGTMLVEREPVLKGIQLCEVTRHPHPQDSLRSDLMPTPRIPFRGRIIDGNSRRGFRVKKGQNTKSESSLFLEIYLFFCI